MTVYREYGDAPTLWRSLLTEEISAVVAAADQTALAAAGNGRERLVTAVIEAVSRLADHPLVTRVLELDPELILPFVVDRLGSGQQLAAERIREMLADGIADGSIQRLRRRGRRPPAAAARAVVRVLGPDRARRHGRRRPSPRSCAACSTAT